MDFPADKDLLQIAKENLLERWSISGLKPWRHSQMFPWHQTKGQPTREIITNYRLDCLYAPWTHTHTHTHTHPTCTHNTHTAYAHHTYLQNTHTHIIPHTWPLTQKQHMTHTCTQTIQHIYIIHAKTIYTTHQKGYIVRGYKILAGLILLKITLGSSVPDGTAQGRKAS